MFDFFNQMAFSFISWAWTWISFLSYWAAVLGGTGCSMSYMVSRDQKTLSFIVKIVMLYIIIMCVDSVI